MKICVFGDSVTYAGYIEKSWVNLMREYLENTMDVGVELYNLGINGNTSIDILKRFEPEAQAREPDKIIFAFGVNDSCYLFDNKKPLIEEVVFKENIISLINAAKKYTKDITFIGLVLGDDSILQPFPESSKGKSYNHKRAKEYDKIISSTALEFECDYIYLYDSLSQDDFIDGLHPNESGHKKMFKIIKKQL